MPEIIKKKEEEKKNAWESFCFPGSLKCLYEQIKQQQSMYFYKGTITTPPCTKTVDYLIMKNPIVISSDDFNALRKNVFAFRTTSENVNKYLQTTTYTDYTK